MGQGCWGAPSSSSTLQDQRWRQPWYRDVQGLPGAGILGSPGSSVQRSRGCHGGGMQGTWSRSRLLLLKGELGSGCAGGVV